MKKTLAVLFAGAALLSCSDDDDDNKTVLEGTWNVTAYSSDMGYLEPEAGQMAWRFRGDDLTVTNTIHAEYPYTIASGEYDFSIANGVVTIENGDYDYTLEGNVLTLASELAPVDGGPIITLEKN